MVPHHLSHSTTQISFFVIIYTPIDSDFQSECNGFIFKKNGQKLIKILYNYSTWITFNNVTWRYMCDNNRSEKPVTRTRENPYPWQRVWVFAGTGPGWPGIPQGYPWYSLINRFYQPFSRSSPVPWPFISLSCSTLTMNRHHRFSSHYSHDSFFCDHRLG